MLSGVHEEPIGEIEFLKTYLVGACNTVNHVLKWLLCFLRSGLSVLICVGSCCFATAQSIDQTVEPKSDGKRSTTVTFDAYHAHTWIDTLPAPGLNNYHLLSNLTRASKSLESLGWESRLQLSPWDSKSLQTTDLVVINLPSADLPPLLVSEVLALREYVENGGGLIVIIDHTNCYFHQHVLGSLFAELDIALWNETACDRIPYKLASGNAWLRVTNFSDHPVVRGIQAIAVETSGVTDSRFGIAWTGPKGWGDAGRVPKYGEGEDIGFFGDFQQQPHERSGALPVVAAKEFGKGKIVVIADQNLVGSLFLSYADNRKLWNQAATWASGRLQSQNIDVEGEQTDSDRSVVWCYEPISKNKAYWGSSDPERLYHAYGLLSKHAEPYATDREVLHATWLILPDDSLLESPDVKSLAIHFVRSPDRNVLVLSNTELPTGAQQGKFEPEWLHSIVGDDSHQEDLDSDRGVSQVLSWRLSNGSKVHVISKSQWDNRAISSPYKTRNEDEERLDLDRLDFFWRNGLRRVEPIDREFHIPNE